MRASVITALLGTLALAGCGSSGSGGATTTQTTSTGTAASQTTAARHTVPSAGPGGQPASGTLVGIRFGQLVPPRLIVIAGHPVHFENFGPQPHQIVATAGARFASGTLAPGAVFTWTPSRAGRVRYRDALPPHAQGTITVIP